MEGVQGFDRRLTVELQGIGSSTSESLDPTTLTGVWRLVSDGATWRRAAGDDTGAAASVTARWTRGSLWLSSAPTVDEEQRRRLAALGYLP